MQSNDHAVGRYTPVSCNRWDRESRLNVFEATLRDHGEVTGVDYKQSTLAFLGLNFVFGHVSLKG